VGFITRLMQLPLRRSRGGSRGSDDGKRLRAYLGCQWKELPIEKDGEGHPETHYTRIYRIWRRWVDNSCMDAIFAGSVSRLHEDGRLDTAVIHGDGTTAAAKKGGDNLGFSGHKKVKGDKVVAFCDRHCNVIAPFVAAPGNRNEDAAACARVCAAANRAA
jgi:hypothetical protein